MDWSLLFLAFDFGALVGMGATAWFIGSRGCYDECLLASRNNLRPTNE
jgi:hypothetical protein